MLNDMLLFIAIGFAAQMVDGAIGMAYGITASTVLISFGVPPATASASIHAAEVFTTAASGTAHWRMGNVDRKLVIRLAVPGMIGGAVGAYVLAEAAGDQIRPIVSAYLMVMGAVIVYRAIWRDRSNHHTPKNVGILGLIGGFLDAIGGGGWGAMVTTTLIGRGAAARFAMRCTTPPTPRPVLGSLRPAPIAIPPAASRWSRPAPLATSSFPTST